jgi:hypothetical protein
VVQYYEIYILWEQEVLVINNLYVNLMLFEVVIISSSAPSVPPLPLAD